MANSDSPRGFRPIRHRNGAPYSGSGSLYHVPVTNGSILAQGDPVIVTGTSDSLGIPDVVLATAGATERITGIVMGRTNGEGTVLQDDLIALPTLTEGYLLIEDNPDVVFEGQMSGAFAVTDVSNNANLLSGTSSVNGVSGWEVDSSGIAATATLQVKILRAVRRTDNEVGANAKVEFMINQHTQNANSLGV